MTNIKDLKLLSINFPLSQASMLVDSTKLNNDIISVVNCEAIPKVLQALGKTMAHYKSINTLQSSMLL